MISKIHSFFKSTLNEHEKYLYDIIIRPFMRYGIITAIFMALSSKNVGVLNDDTFGGLFIAFIITGFNNYYTILQLEAKENKKGE